MASIPADSPDSFGLTPPPSSGSAFPGSAATTPSSSSWIKLSLDQGSSRLYALWQVDESDRTKASQQGANTLAIRLYDVTGQTSNAPLSAPVDQVQCSDPYARDWYLQIPQLDRIYLAELGLLDGSSRWYSVARSNPLPAIT
jgi:hypothetical protein